MMDYKPVSMPRGSRCKGCPWCDSANYLEIHKGNPCRFWIQCRNFAYNYDGCFAEGPIGETAKEAVMHWNRRAGDDK